MDDILNRFHEMPIFKALSDDQLRALAALVREESCPAGQPVFREGEEAASMYIVRTGEVELRKRFLRDRGQAKTLAVVEAGGFFGELAFFGPARRATEAVARTDTRLWKLDYDDLQRLTGSDAAGAVNVLQVILRMLVPKLGALIEEHAVLFELARLLPKIETVGELAKVVFDLILDAVDAEDAGLLAVWNVFNEEYDIIQSTKHVTERQLGANHPVARELRQTRSELIIPRTSQDARFKDIPYLGRSFIAAPVLYADDLRGLVILANTAAERAFRSSHRLLLKTVCTLMGEKLHDLERRQEDTLRKRLAEGKLSADI
jgi:CRP/FNR family transcriptional regulator, cyclic AMP receptor protein